MTTNRPEFKAHDDFIFEHKEIGKVTREEFIKYIRSSHEHMRKLSQIIQQYNQTIDEYLNEWDGRFESFDEDVKDLLGRWINDGTMDHIINETLMSTKADKEYVDDLNENVTAQLAQKANQSTVDILQSEKMNREELISVDQLDKNTKKLDQTFLSEELIEQMAGNAPINAIPADNSLTTAKYVDGSVTNNKLDPRFFRKGVFEESGDLNNFWETGSYYVSGGGILNKPDNIYTGMLMVFNGPSGFTTQIFHDIQPTNNFYIRNLRFWNDVPSMVGEWQLMGIDSYMTTTNKEWVV